MKTHVMSTSGFGVHDIPPDRVREAIYSIEKFLKDGRLVELRIEHEFAHGIYLRKIWIPKGVSLTGRVHKQDDLQIIFSGEISILTEHGLKRFTGPDSFTSKAGTKPFALAHEDTVYATAHHTHLTNLDEIEKELFENEEGMYDFQTGEIKREVLPCQRP